MAEVGANAAAYVVSESALGANVVEKAGGETAAESLIEDADGVVIGVATSYAESDQMNVALIHIFFGDEVVAGLCGVVLDFGLRKIGTFWPRVEGGVQFGFDTSRIEIAGNAENHVIGVNVGFVPVDYILARNGGDGRIFGLASVGIVFAVG